jgi:tetratricopeptide (TPR) repeat protein
MGALDELLASWRSNPDADSTVALCAYLGATGQETLVREVGSTAQTWHGQDTSVMLSVGRMYLDAGLMPEAQAALVNAGKVGGANPKPFRYLGEVLLRRGDASRAEKVLVRAMQLGLDDADTRHWHDRASFYIALQKRNGPLAVATEVAKALPRSVSIPPPAVRPQGFGSEDLTNPKGASGSLPRFDSAEEVSQVEELPAPTPAVAPRQARAARAPTMIGVAPPPGARAPAGRVVMPGRTMPSPPPPAPTSFSDLQADLLEDEAKTVSHGNPFEEPTNRVVMSSPFDAPTRPHAVAYAQTASPLPPPSVPPPYPRAVPAPGNAFLEPATSPSAPPTRPYDAGVPPPGILLEHLARVGVFEPQGGAPPAWERPGRVKTRSPWVFALASLLLVGLGIGGWQYAKKLKLEKQARADTLAAEVDKLLHSGGVAELRSTDEKLSQAFELDSLSPRAARLWLENRVLGALMLGGEPRGIDSAIHRGRTVGLAEKDLAFGRMASFLVEGDLAGAAAQLPKWDKEAGRDAYYQLAAGAVLERAGDLRAIERYEAARTLDPKLAVTDILLSRLALLEFGKDRSSAVMASVKSKLGDHPSVRALRALQWVVDPERSDDPPADAKLTAEDAARLPAPLAAVPPMLEAARAVKSGDRDKLSRSLGTAIGLADTPSLAAGLGFLAIEAGDEQLARKAALRAVGFAALYPRARTLAARVALLGGRVDEAQKAIEQLEPTSAEVAVVRAVAAYESLEAGDVDAALRVLGEGAQSHAFTGLALGSGILMGTKYPTPEERDALRDPSIPWGELIAIDAALDQGAVEPAAQILEARTGEALRPVHLLRLARLRRYQNMPAKAVEASAAALEGNVTAPVLIERTYDLVAAEDLDGARTLIAKYPALLGPLGGWLAAFVDGNGKEKSDKAQAASRAAKLDLPPDGSALALRVLVLRALVVSGDKRASAYLRGLAFRASKHPDVQFAIKDM